MSLDIYQAMVSTLRFLAFTLPLIAITAAATSFTIRRGLMDRLAEKTQPMLERINLSHITATSVALCFVSATASYSVLAQALKDEAIDEREVIAASFINSFPSMFSHTYRFFIPFVIPVLGWTGIIYTVLRMLVALIKSGFGVVMARVWKRQNKGTVQSVEYRVGTTASLLKRTAVMMAATYFLVQIASQLGVFKTVSEHLYHLPLEPPVITIVATQLINAKAAVVVGAGLLERGEISKKWLLAALMLGNVITLSTSYVKHSLPFHISLFGKLGVKIVALNAIASLFLDILVIAGVVLLL